ncbi:MAG: MobF family relaxase [Bacteroidota bacterium]
MLRITARYNAENAKAYFDKALAQEDYYLKEASIGTWHGQVKTWLGLPDTITRDTFHALCDNRHPRTQKSLTPRTNSHRRVGYDFTFSAPKAVSIVQALTNDQRIETAFNDAVTSTMQSIEHEMKTRVRRNGSETDRLTGNLLWGRFTHYTARPVNGVPDPHLHAHCFAMNLTYDLTEERFKAGQFGDLKRDAPYFQAVFNHRLATALEGLGYTTERSTHGFTLSGISPELTQKFSRRTAVIEAEAEAKNIVSPVAKARLGSRTREAKQADRSLAELEHDWMNRLTTDELMTLSELAGKPRAERGGEQAAIAHAMAVSLERSSVVPERTVLTKALAYGVGHVREDQLTQALSDKAYLKFDLHDAPVYTTRSVLREEQSLIAFARNGRNRFTPLHQDIEQYRFTAEYLNEGQRGAVHHLLQSPDQIIGIRGPAGTGKTTMMTEAIQAIEDSGHQVFVFAPSAQAARKVLRDEGFTQAETVAHLLNNPQLQQQLHNQVMWIDEAGLLGTQAMRQICDVAERYNTRVILSGDYGQHSSVPRGDALRILADNGGLTLYRLSEIMRQKNAGYREAVHSIAEGRLLEGTQQLDRLGAIIEATGDERYTEIAEAYRTTISQKKGKQRHRTALVVSPTHAEGRRATSAIRASLQAHGHLGSSDTAIPHLHNTGLTTAERQDYTHYATGDLIEFTQHAPGVRKGERFVVQATAPDHLTAEHSSDGQLYTLPLGLADRFATYRQSTLPIAVGEKIVITKNGKTKDKQHRLHNGASYTVKALTPSGDLLLTNGWVVAQDFGHLTHGYCTTSHKAQGRSVDTVIIAQSTLSTGASDNKQWYVSVSRGKHEVRVYTDDKALLFKNIQRDGNRLSAIEAEQASYHQQRAQKQRQHLRTSQRESQHQTHDHGYERER